MDENKTTTSQTAEAQSEDTLLAMAIGLQLWDEYWDEVTELKAKGEDKNEEYRKLFAELHGVRKDSPIALMFQAFTGGLTKGLLLADKLGAEESQPW